VNKFELRGGGPADGLAWTVETYNTVADKIVLIETQSNGFPEAFQIRMGGLVESDELSDAVPSVPVVRYVYSGVDGTTNTAIFLYTPLTATPV
jgi:hypothetical protein